MHVQRKRLNIANMTKIALCIAMLCVSSFLVIPLPFTSSVLSLHTVMVNLIGLILTPWQAFITMFVYLLMGLIGLPVFSAGTAGPGKLFGPTGGYYFGFLIAVVLISLLKGKKGNVFRYGAVTILIGLPIQHICAILMMCFHNGFHISASFFTISLPFIPGDIFKCILASVVGVALNKVLKRYRMS